MVMVRIIKATFEDGCWIEREIDPLDFYIEPPMPEPTPLVQVPREPTEAMLTAAAGVGDVPDFFAAVWRAMVEAAEDE